jgi:hypothetical protein
VPHHDDCPVCRVYHLMAVVAGLLEDGIAYADGSGALPPGLGGTIAQARGEVDQALALAVGPVAAMVPGQQSSTLGQGLIALRGELNGWLDAGRWQVAVTRARTLRPWAYAVAAAHWAR